MKLRTLTILLVLVLALAACAESAPGVDDRRDPNGVSELALLLREMTSDMERLRAHPQRGARIFRSKHRPPLLGQRH